MDAPSKAVEIKAAITAVLAFGTALWGTIGWTVIILAVCIVLDYITGTLAAIHSEQWSSSVARQGLWHKLGEILALCVASLCDIAIHVIISSSMADVLNGLPIPSCTFTLVVSIWYIFTELGSIIENAAELGAPVPQFLINILVKLKSKTEPPDTSEDK